MIVQNPNVPQAQTVQLDHETQIGFGNGAGPGSQLEPEKEKIHNQKIWSLHNMSLNKSMRRVQHKK